MKKSFAVCTLVLIAVAPARAQDLSSDQLNQVLNQLQEMGVDQSSLPDSGQLQQIMSGESGKLIRQLSQQMDRGGDKKQKIGKLLRKFDHNGDGMLGPKEREAARRAWHAQHGDQSQQTDKLDRIRDHFDRNGDGQLNDRELAHARRTWQDHQLQKDRTPRDRADHNDDGRLSQRERDAAARKRQQNSNHNTQPTSTRKRGQGNNKPSMTKSSKSQKASTRRSSSSGQHSRPSSGQNRRGGSR
jgi:hypothetical protein